MQPSTPKMLKEWIADFHDLKSENFSDYKQKYFGKKSFYESLDKALESKMDIEIISGHLHSMAITKSNDLKIALFDVIPIVLKHYLLNYNRHHTNNSKLHEEYLFHLKTCLLSVVRILLPEIDNGNNYCNANFVLPNFTDGSLFHSPVGRPDLEYLNQSVTLIPAKESISSDIELTIGLIRIYNYYLNEFSEVSLNDYCILATKITSINSSNYSRIPVNPMLLIELLNGIYLILFKEQHVTFAIQALTSIETRANYELITDAILITNSIQNSLRSNPSGHPLCGPIGINVFIRNRTETITNENVITNASFRPEKLPNDIDSIPFINESNGVWYESTDSIEMHHISMKLSDSTNSTSNAKQQQTKFRMKQRHDNSHVLCENDNTKV